MIEFYPQIHNVHVAAITMSFVWMMLRGLLHLSGKKWSSGGLFWAISLSIDGTVLTVAAMLFSVLPDALFANHWLDSKLIFVCLYYVSGYTLLLAYLSRKQQAALLLLAFLSYAMAFGIAHAHHPLGWFAH